MTYEEFKKALCRNVQNMETAQNKTIRLLERQMICSDPMAVHIMSVMNRHMYGRENILIREDMLCAMWSLKGKSRYSTGRYDRYTKDTDRKGGKVFCRRSQQVLKNQIRKRCVVYRGKSELCCLQRSYEDTTSKF